MNRTHKSNFFKIAALIILNFTIIPSVFALEITGPGTYVIDSRVDEVSIDGFGEDVYINVVSGGVVEGDISCNVYHYSCSATVDVSGHGTVLGGIVGDGFKTTLRDYAWVQGAGSSIAEGGSLVIQDYAHLETMYDPAPSASTLTMNGGSLGSYSAAEGGIFVDMTGGTFEGPLIQAETILTMTDGQFMNGIFSYWGATLDIKGGQIWGNGNLGVIYGGDSGASGLITGGAFNAREDEYLLRLFGGTDTLSIYGGHFGNVNSGSGFFLGGGQILDVYGIDIEFEDGILSGHLRDGSYINVAVDFSERFGGNLNIYNVPEPTSLALLGIGIAGLGFSYRKKNYYLKH